jgi:hypothetical protein
MIIYIDRSTHLRNFFSAIGISEVSNKMASCTTEQEVFVVKTFYYSDGPFVVVER